MYIQKTPQRRETFKETISIDSENKDKNNEFQRSL
jgi:hypothetical protein